MFAKMVLNGFSLNFHVVDGLVLSVRSVLFRLVVFVGLGSLLTLVSCVYSRSPEPMFLDVAPTYFGEVQYGFPFPVYLSYAAWWEPSYEDWIYEAHFDFHNMVLWLGAFLDIVVYAAGLWVGYGIVMQVRSTRRKPQG